MIAWTALFINNNFFSFSSMEGLQKFLHFFFVASLLISTTAISDHTPKVHTYTHTSTLAYYVQFCYMPNSQKLILFYAALCCLYGKFITKQNWSRKPNSRIIAPTAIVINYSKVHYLVYYNFTLFTFYL